MNSLRRRDFCAGVAVTLMTTRASAQAFPVRPVRLIIPFPGGFTDILARLVAEKMSERLGQPVLVEQKPGGSGQIAAAELLRSAADGHTMMLIHIGTHAINPHLFPKLSYDPVKDFTPLTQLVTVPNLLVCSPTLSGVNSVSDLVALAKAKPGTLFFGSPGAGSSGHMAGELFRSMAGVQVTHVPYKGAAEVIQDLYTGRVHFMFDTLAQGSAQAKGGKVRALAVTSAQRHPKFPDYPTMAESGFPGWDTGAWFGLAVRSGTPVAAAQRLQEEAARALGNPELRERLLNLGSTPVGDSAEHFTATIQGESQRWGKLVRDLGIKLE
jgi:tripartite-type tricarboxylate transporter receptor subunit TctC